MMLSQEDKDLIESAKSAIRKNYDSVRWWHTVGAAVRTGTGKVYVGVNCDSVSHGACAEVIAIGSAVTAGEREFDTIVAVLGGETIRVTDAEPERRKLIQRIAVRRRKKMENKSIVIKEERISAEEYIDFLKRTDLGSQYPKERFEERIARLVRNVSISLVARNEAGLIIGVLFGLTDFCYWLYITDLGVDRDYERQGIATKLMKTAHDLAGGEKDIAVYLIANENAVPFYEKLGMKKADDVMQYNHIEWTEWTVK